MKIIGAMTPAEQFISDLEINTWYRFKDIPPDMFEQVFDLINTAWRYDYDLDDFDEKYKKHFKDHEISKTDETPRCR